MVQSPHIESTSVIHVDYGGIDHLIPYCNNPRTRGDARIAQIATGIAEPGWMNPVLVDDDNGVMAGHGRLMADRKPGMDSVSVIESVHLIAARRKAYVIADNRCASTWRGTGLCDESFSGSSPKAMACWESTRRVYAMEIGQGCKGVRLWSGDRLSRAGRRYWRTKIHDLPGQIFSKLPGREVAVLVSLAVGANRRCHQMGYSLSELYVSASLNKTSGREVISMGHGKDSNPARRRLLKALAGGSGLVYSSGALPTGWSRPVVESVFLPAHAQTTDITAPSDAPDQPSPPGPVSCSGTPNCQQDAFPSPLLRLTWSASSLNFEVNPGSLDGATGSTSIEANGDFSGTGGATFSCVGGTGNGRLELEISGNLNTSTGEVSGSFVVTILCDSVQQCVVCADFSGSLSENVEGEPPVSGVESECCPDSSLVL